MPLAPERVAAYHREYRRKRKAERVGQTIAAATAAPDLFTDQRALADALPAPAWPEDPAEAAAAWAESRLRVPAGRLRGAPFLIPDWQRAFLAGMLAAGTREAWLTCARKNGKSGLIAAVLLGFLAPDGPLRTVNWRGLVVSLTGALAGELRRQVEEIIDASEIAGVEVRRSPAPGRIVGISGSCEILAADKSSGHAAGADLAIIDEAGLLPERKRPLWDAVSTAVSGRDGRIVGISVLGDGPMFREALDRDGVPGVHVVRYEAPADCDLQDPAAWSAANPGLESGIKSPDYMAHKAREAVDNPASAAGFRALDLNQPIAPSVELLCDREQWQRIEVGDDFEHGEREERAGRCWLGIDLGGSRSLTAAVALWESGWMDAWCAAAATPDPLARGRRDGVGDAYVRAVDSGHLTLCGQHIVDVRAFLASVFEHVPAAAVIGCDRYRQSELLEVLAALERMPAVRWRGTGASATADGSADVRAFQRAVAERTIRCAPNPMMRLALGQAAVRRDAAGNPALERASGSSRIDLAAAAVIACGLRALARDDKRKGRGFRIAGGGGV